MLIIILKIVLIKLIAPKIEDKPAKCKLKIAISTDGVKDMNLTPIRLLLGGLLWWHGVAKPLCSRFENKESTLILILLAVHAVLSCNEGFKVAQMFMPISLVYYLFVIFFYCSYSFGSMQKALWYDS